MPDVYTICSNLTPGPFQYKFAVLAVCYRDSHYKDKTVWRPSCLYNGILHTWRDILYIETGPRLAQYMYVHKCPIM